MTGPDPGRLDAAAEHHYGIPVVGRCTLVSFLLIAALGCGQEPEPDETAAPPCELLPVEAATVRWSIKGEGQFRGSATIDAEGFVYVGNESGKLYKLDPATGGAAWVFDCCVDQPTPEWDPELGQQCNVDSTPAIDRDGHLWFGCWNGSLIKMATTGQELCRHLAQDEVSSSPAIDVDGSVYVGSEDRMLWSVDGTDCSVRWSKHFPEGAVYGSPAITETGLIISTSADDHVYAWNRAGELQWKVETGFDVYSSAALSPDGTIYAGSGDHHLYAIDHYGRVQWRYRANHRLDSSPVLGLDGTIYVGSWDSNLYALNPDGTLQWAFQTGDEIRSSPVVGCDGTIYVGSFDDHLYAVAADGTLRWKLQLDGDIFASPTISDDGTLYVGTHGGTFYAIQTDSAGLARSAWPQLKGGRWRRAHQCGSEPGACPCADSEGCDGGDACTLERCGGGDDDCSGVVDDHDVCDSCTATTCQATATSAASCGPAGCVRTCEAGFGGQDCRTPEPGGTGPGSIEWVVSTGDSVLTVAAPLPDGSVFVGSGDYWLYRLGPKGEIACKYLTFYRADGEPLVTANGQVWFGSEDQTLHGVDMDCNGLCDAGAAMVTAGNIRGRPVELSTGDLAFASGDGRLYRASPSACALTELADLGGTIYGGPAALGDRLFVGSNAGVLVAVDGVSKARLWERPDVGQIVASPAVTSDGAHVLFGSKDGTLRVVDAADGSPVWSVSLGTQIWSAPLVTAQGRLLAAGLDGVVRAFDPNGSEWTPSWSVELGSPVRGPLAHEAGVVYVASDDGRVTALDAAGKTLWTVQGGSSFGTSGPALTPDGRLVIGNEAGHILSIRR